VEIYQNLRSPNKKTKQKTLGTNVSLETKNRKKKMDE